MAENAFFKARHLEVGTVFTCPPLHHPQARRPKGRAQYIRSI